MYANVKTKSKSTNLVDYFHTYLSRFWKIRYDYRSHKVIAKSVASQLAQCLGNLTAILLFHKCRVHSRLRNAFVSLNNAVLIV